MNRWLGLESSALLGHRSLNTDLYHKCCKSNLHLIVIETSKLALQFELVQHDYLNIKNKYRNKNENQVFL